MTKQTTIVVIGALRVKMGILIMIFLFFYERICFGYSLEVPHRACSGISNEYPQYIFSWRNKKIYHYFSVKKVSYFRQFLSN